MVTANIDSYVTVPLSSAAGPRRSNESLRETRAELQPVWHDVALCSAGDSRCMTAQLCSRLHRPLRPLVFRVYEPSLLTVAGFSLTAVTRELARYKLDLVGVQVRWDKGGTVRAGDYNF